MIATVTLNPALDKTLIGSRLVMGDVNRMDEVKSIPGGKGINVAKVLAQYGYEVKALGFLGGYTGKYIGSLVESYGIKTAFTQVAGETRTSTNVISDDGYITELLEPGPFISKEEIDAFLSAYETEIKDCEMVVISGSAPQGVDAEMYAQMINAANKMGKKVLLDTSGNNLKKGMYARPYFMKPNIKELETLQGKKMQNLDDIKDAATEIVEWGVPHVMVSMGSKGIVYAYEENGEVMTSHIPAPKIKVINSVGSGDSAVAAFAMAQLDGLDPIATLKRCVAISCTNAISLENGVIDKEKAAEIEASL